MRTMHRTALMAGCLAASSMLASAAFAGTLHDASLCGASDGLHNDGLGNTLTGGSSIGLRATSGNLCGEMATTISNGGPTGTGSGHLDAMAAANSTEPVITAAGLGAVSDVDKIDNSQSG